MPSATEYKAVGDTLANEKVDPMKAKTSEVTVAGTFEVKATAASEVKASGSNVLPASVVPKQECTH